MSQNKTFKGPTFDLALFEKLNWERCIGPFNCGDKSDLYFTTAIAEEVGEICGAVKKLERGFNHRELAKMRKKNDAENLDVTDGELELAWFEQKKEDVGNEIADAITYILLLAAKNNINTWKYLQQKFNRVSDEMNCPEFKI